MFTHTFIRMVIRGVVKRHIHFLFGPVRNPARVKPPVDLIKATII